MTSITCYRGETKARATLLFWSFCLLLPEVEGRARPGTLVCVLLPLQMTDLLLHVVRSLWTSQASLSNSSSNPLLGSHVKTTGMIKHDDRQPCLPRRSLPFTRSLKALPLIVSSPFPSALLVLCQWEESNKEWRWPQAALQEVFWVWPSLGSEFWWLKGGLMRPKVEIKYKSSVTFADPLSF